MTVTKIIGLAGLLAAGFLVRAQQIDDVPVLTVCQVFDDLQALNGRVVVVIARVLGYCGFSQRKYLSLAMAATFHKRFAAAQDDQIYFDA